MRHTVIRPLARTARTAPVRTATARTGTARTALASSGIPRAQRLGSLIGGIFGLIYVEVNAGSLPDPWATVLQIAAGVAVAGLAVVLALGRAPRSSAPSSSQGGFRGSYWLVVAGEAAAILGGAAILNGPAGLPRAAVAWVSVVVGVHFLVLAASWRLPLFRRLGAGIALCGAAGLVAAVSGASPAVIATTGGVLPGVLLLTASYLGAATQQSAAPARPEEHTGNTGTGS